MQGVTNFSTKSEGHTEAVRAVFVFTLLRDGKQPSPGAILEFLGQVVLKAKMDSWDFQFLINLFIYFASFELGVLCFLFLFCFAFVTCRIISLEQHYFMG